MPAKTMEKPAVEAKSAEAARVSVTRQRELDAARSSITKADGEGSNMRLGDARAQTRIDEIPTGALAHDLAQGGGGAPRGRAAATCAPQASGNTNDMMHVI